MPIKREDRGLSESTATATPTTADNIITPPETQQPNTNQYDSILQLVESQKAMMEAQQKQIENLSKKVAASGNDISEEVKESKRRYGFDFSGNRIPEESFKFSYRVLMHDRKEKVVISSVTQGRPVNFRNENTGKWTNVHNVEIVFHDGTKTEMDVLDYINQYVKEEATVPDADIKTVDGIKHYTFRDTRFGTFTVSQNFIN